MQHAWRVAAHPSNRSWAVSAGQFLGVSSVQQQLPGTLSAAGGAAPPASQAASAAVVAVCAHPRAAASGQLPGSRAPRLALSFSAQETPSRHSARSSTRASYGNRNETINRCCEPCLRLAMSLSAQELPPARRVRPAVKLNITIN